MPPIARGILVSVIFLSFLGLLNASFLAYHYYFSGPPSCTISGCETVTTSEYAEIAGVSVALLGAFFYFVMAGFGILLYRKPRPALFLSAVTVSIAGVLASVWFTYVQFGILKAVCVYCLFSALETLVIFILMVWLIIRYNETI